MIDYSEYEDEDYVPRKANRRRKIDRRNKAHEDFMRINSRGLKDTILPLLEKKAKKARREHKFYSVNGLE